MYKTSTDIASAILSFILEGEQGLHMDGVKREVFTIFWERAFERFFEGQATFVPRVGPDCLRQKLPSHWKSHKPWLPINRYFSKYHQ